jgi:hypothetical protein
MLDDLHELHGWRFGRRVCLIIFLENWFIIHCASTIAS